MAKLLRIQTLHLELSLNPEQVLSPKISVFLLSGMEIMDARVKGGNAFGVLPSNRAQLILVTIIIIT